jgi:hypothetical protein
MATLSTARITPALKAWITKRRQKQQGPGKRAEGPSREAALSVDAKVNADAAIRANFVGTVPLSIELWLDDCP